MNNGISTTIDMHCHVGVVGDKHPEWGRLAPAFQKELRFKLFLLYAKTAGKPVCDDTLIEHTFKLLAETRLEHVVCLAQDPVFDRAGTEKKDCSPMWTANDYVLWLREQPETAGKVLFGASVHPYDPAFRDRVKHYVDQGAVLLKWIPSAQHISLADHRIRSALEFLATAGPDGHPLPLLLHVGGEYANPTSDPRTHSYDFLSWSVWDRLQNLFRGKDRWYRPRLHGVHRNLRAGLDAGATIIFAHAGLPYYTGGTVGELFEHSDFDVVRRYLRRHGPQAGGPGACYADVSSCVTPIRRTFYDDLKALPPEALLFGSDFPTPVFELTPTPEERLADLRAVIAGDWSRIIVPEGNLLDVNYHELHEAFGDHPMFTNFRALMPEAALAC